MPNETKTEGTDTAGAVRSGKMTFAEATAGLSDEPAGDTESADTAQSKTTDKVGDVEAKEGQDAGDQTDDQEGSDTDGSDTEDGEDKDGEEEDDSEEEESDQESDDEVKLPEPVAKIVEDLQASEPEKSKELRAYLQDQEKLIAEADRTIMANAGVLGIFEALTNEETQREAFDKSVEVLAKEVGQTVPALMLKFGYVPAPTGDVATPEFLGEGNHESLIADVLKDAEFQEGAGLEDAKLGAKMMLDFLVAKVPEMLPADYHGEFQDYKKQKAKETEQSAARAEATKVAKSNYAPVASKIARQYESFKVTEDQVREAIEAFPMLPKTKPDEVFTIVELHLRNQLVKHIRNATTRREKKKMPDSAGRGGDHKPKAKTPYKPGTGRSSFKDMVPG